ncbi:MAG: VWA domain-containing protein [Aridibacter sp.]
MKSLYCILGLLAIFLIPTVVSSQTPQPTATPIDDDDVVKITTNLIQIDVIVTDKKGNQVTDLKPEDFEIYENGKKQNITNFSYILSKSKQDSSDDLVEKLKGKYSVPAPPAKLKLEQVKRTYAIVVDDLGLTFSSIPGVKRSIRKFINEQMQDGDLVAIIRTGSGIGALQSFTNNKNQLLAAVEKIKWNSQGRGGISIFEPIVKDIKEEMDSTRKGGKNVAGATEDAEFKKNVEEFRNENFSVGTLGALDYIVRGMSDLPGRKAVVLFSEGFVLLSEGKPTRVFDGMRRLADLANRSSVIIYTLDPRGLQVPSMALAEDDITEVLPDGYDPGRSVDPTDGRDSAFTDSQMSLRYLAEETGGVAFINQNDLTKGLRKVIEDQKGYYLIAYQPNEDTFDPKKIKFNEISIKLKRDDLRVRYRSGFFGIADEKLKQVALTPQRKLIIALVSPFSADEVNLDLYTVFYNDSRNRSFIRSFVYIDTNDLTFTRNADGTYQAKFDIMAMVFNSNGMSADNNITTHTLKFTEEQYERFKGKGIIYDLPVPIIIPGAYQFRVAVQDTVTKKTGSASQFIEIPNIDKKRLALSNIIVKQYSPKEWKKISLGQIDDSNEPNNTALLDSVKRNFKPGTILTYSFVIYNAKSNAKQPPQLQMQTRLFHDGKMILQGESFPINVNGQSDLRRIEISSAVTLGTDLHAGNYALQIIVSDSLAKGKRQIASQLIDFEINK